MEYTKIFDNIILDNNITFLKNIKEVSNDDLLNKEIYVKILDLENNKNDLSDVNQYESDIFKRLDNIEKLTFKRPWNKLSKEQKKIKLLDFFKNHIIHNNKNTDKIKKMILNDFDKNKLNSVKKINYDIFSAQIVKIVNFEYNKDTQEYSYCKK